MKLKYIFLTMSLIAFAVGFNSGDSVYLGAGLPFGAILFGFFMIVSVLEREMALLDKQRAGEAGMHNSIETKFVSFPPASSVNPGYVSIATQ